MKKNLFAAVLICGLVCGVSTVAVAEHHETVTVELQAEVLKVDGNTVVIKRIPSGEIHTTDVDPAREINLDGKMITVKDLPAGTMLSAKVDVVPSEETIEQVSGTIMHIVAKTVVLRMDSGEVKSFTVDYDREFMVDGQPKTIREMREGTRVTATRLLADPSTIIKPDTPIYGKAPK